MWSLTYNLIKNYFCYFSALFFHTFFVFFLNIFFLILVPPLFSSFLGSCLHLGSFFFMSLFYGQFVFELKT